MSSTYEGDFAESLARLELVIKEHRDWLGVNWVDRNSGPDHVVKVLDYACGPGTVSRVSVAEFIFLDAFNIRLTVDRHCWISRRNSSVSTYPMA